MPHSRGSGNGSRWVSARAVGVGLDLRDGLGDPGPVVVTTPVQVLHARRYLLVSERLRAALPLGGQRDRGAGGADSAASG